MPHLDETQISPWWAFPIATSGVEGVRFIRFPLLPLVVWRWRGSSGFPLPSAGGWVHRVFSLPPAVWRQWVALGSPSPSPCDVQVVGFIGPPSACGMEVVGLIGFKVLQAQHEAP